MLVCSLAPCFHITSLLGVFFFYVSDCFEDVSILSLFFVRKSAWMLVCGADKHGRLHTFLFSILRIRSLAAVLSEHVFLINRTRDTDILI